MKVLQILIFICLLSILQAYAQQKGSSDYRLSGNGFIENKGQIVDQNYKPNPGVKYLLNGNGLNVQLRQSGFSYDTYTEETFSGKNQMLEHSKFKTPDSTIRHYHRVDIELVGCNTAAPLVAENKSQAYYNYFTAGTPAGGVSDVHYYQKVTYKNIYPNIDLEFTASLIPSKGGASGGKGNSGNEPSFGGQGGFEYNFIVHPGGNPSDIKLAYKGANNIKLDNNKLVVSVAAGDFTENIPGSYWQKTKEAVEVKYIALQNLGVEGNVYGFSVALPLGKVWGGTENSDLIIDPTPNLLWGTYYGQTASALCYGIALDASNNVYVTGNTSGGAGMATAGAYQVAFGGVSDAYIAKLNSTGSALIWGTYYGGSNNDYSYAIALDASNNVYITGTTSSNTGISTAGAYQGAFGGNYDAFVAKFNSTGTALLWGTYYGAVGAESGLSIAVDGSNNVYITGETSSATGIATAGAHQTAFGGGSTDGFVAKFNSNGSVLLWGTYYGGANFDYGYGIALDAADNVYITGYTGSLTNIATAGAHQTVLAGNYDAFVAKFDPTGSFLLWGTYYGGTNGDYAYGIALDAGDNIYITGNTQSTAGIATAGAYQTAGNSTYGDVFIAKFNPTGTTLLWGTYYGGAFSGTQVSAITLDPSDNAYITGRTQCLSGIATAGAYQTTYGGGSYNNFLAKFNPTGSSLLFGTYYGGIGSDYSYAITLDGNDNVYIAGVSDDPSGISTAGVYQTTLANAANGFIAKFSGCSGAPPPPGAITGPTTVCNGSVNTYKIAPVPGATNYTWILPAGWTGASTTDSIVATAGVNGGNISVTVTNVCGTSTAQTLAVTVNNVSVSITPVNESCFGYCTGTATANPTGTGPFIYAWSNAATSSTITGLCIGTYSTTVTGLGGCTATASVTITQPASAASITIASQTNISCFGGTGSATANAATGGTGPYNYNWTPSGGTNLTANNLIAGTYTITAIDNNGCTATASVTITQPASAVGITVASQTNVSCFGGTGSAAANAATGGTGPYTYNWTPSGGTNLTANNLIAGTYTITAIDNNGCTATASVTITQPASAVGITVASQTNVSCFGGTGSAAANAATGGTGPYTYNWTPSGGTNLTANNLVAGTYTMTATDNNGCTATTSVTITEPTALTAIPNATPASLCQGDCSTINATTTGGMPPYTYLWSSGATASSVNVCPATTTNYSVTVTDGNGCTFTTNVAVTVHALPNVTLSIAQDTACSLSSSDLLTGTPAGGVYSGLGVTGNNFNPSNVGAGTYTLKYTYNDSNGCNNSDSISVSVSICTGISEVTLLESRIKFYPNPFSQSINIDNSATEAVVITMFNIMGQKMGSWQLDKGLNTINTEAYQSGIYMIQVKTKDGLLNKKLVKVN